MKKFLLFTGSMFFVALSAFSQITIFHENFEVPNPGDSVISTQEAIPGSDDWSISNRMHQGANSFGSDTCQIKTGKTCYLTSLPFNTVGNTNVILHFWQVCKVDALDIATIEVSNNGGTTWTQLTGTQYQGAGAYVNNANKFACNSYGALWQPSAPAVMPQFTWFKHEIFDVSLLIGNCPNAKFRFKLEDNPSVPGPGGNPPNVKNNRGWYIDNISVVMSYSELAPPTITLVNPILTGVTYNTGPYQVRAKIYDFSGVDIAKLVYSVNNGVNDTVPMVFQAIDTNWVANLPVLADSSYLCYYVIAWDASLSHNFASNPLPASCIPLTFYAPFRIPYNDNFDATNSLWEAGPATNDSQWQLGTPNYGATNSAHSPPKAWDVNLTSEYTANDSCYVLSPPLNFTNAFNARLSFWYNYKTQANYDGFRLQYSINGGTWKTLGRAPNPLPDTLGVNWYTTNNLIATGDSAWEGNSGGWQQAKYRLTVLNNQTLPVRFRFTFNSTGYTNSDGVSIDDFTIVIPAPQEASADKVLAPFTGCGLGLETVKLRIINDGLTPINPNILTASYQRDPAAPIVTEPVNQTIAVGDTIIYTFTTLVDLSTAGADKIFNIKCWVTMPNDPNHGDDTTFKTITSQYIPNPPLVTTQLIPYGSFTTTTATSTLPVTWYDACNGGTSFYSGPTYTTPILYGMMIYYPKVVAPNGCISGCAFDTINVSSPPPHDGSTVSINTPVTNFNLLTPQTVQVTVRNYGTDTMTNFPIKYIATGPANLSCLNETFPGSVAPGAIANYTFTQLADIHIYGSYLFKAWIEVPGDLNHINDTATLVVQNKMFSYCISASTDLYPPVADNIGNITISNMNNGIAIPTTSNPTSLQHYTDFTNLPPIQLSRIQVYSFSISTIYGNGTYSTVAKVFVDWNWNGGFEEATETACTLSIPSGGPYTVSANITVPANAHLGLTRFRVVLVQTTTPSVVVPCGPYTYGETEDYLTLVIPQLANDAGVIAITMPPVTYPEGVISPVTVTVKNFGLDSVPSSCMNVHYQIDNGPIVTQLYTGSISATGGTATIPFPSVSLLAGNHTICAWTTLCVADSNTYNDTTCKAIYGIPVDPLPYYDNFDSTVNFTTVPSGGTNWIHGAPISTLFPNNAHSSPNVWGTNLNITGGYGNSANCSLITQLFTFNNAMNAKLSFWMKRNTESLIDGCVLDYSLDNGSTWQILGTTNDPNGTNWYNGNVSSAASAGWSGSVAQWVKVTYKLSLFNTPYTGEVRFRFRFVSNTYNVNSGVFSGVFIDDFEIFKPYMTDAGIDSIMLPNGTDAAGYPGHVKVRLNNFSRVPLTSVNISYKIGTQPPVTELWTGNLAPEDNVAYTFNTTYGIPQGDYCLKSYTSLPNDSANINDTAYKCAFGIPVFEIPFVDRFDSITSFWYTEGPQWERGTPSGTPTSINTPYSAPNCWKTKIASPYAIVGRADLLYSPMFNLTYGYDSITFYHWVDTYSGDKAWVEYLAVDGSGNKTWKRLGNMGDPYGVNWYTSGASGFVNAPAMITGWHRSAYDLKILSDIANPAQFRYNFYCYYANNHNPVNAGWAIDNFELTTPRIPQDAGVVSILQPTTSVTYGTNLDVKVRIRNFGTDPLFNIPLKYMINGTTVAAANWTGVLLADSTVDYQFPAISSPLSSFDLCAYTDVPFDTKLDNDTSCNYISVVAPPYDVSITQIISPVDTTIWGNQTTVTVKIKNHGFNQVTSIPLEYRVADTGIIVNETWDGVLNQNEEQTYTFAQTYDYEYLAYYYLCVLTKLPNDGYKANDTLCAKIDNKWTSIPENPDGGFYLAQNYPNPGDGYTEIEYKVPGAGEITFALVNYLGQRMMYQNEKVSQGEHKLLINTSKMPAGMYYYYISYEGKRMIRKMVIIH